MIKRLDPYQLQADSGCEMLFTVQPLKNNGLSSVGRPGVKNSLRAFRQIPLSDRLVFTRTHSPTGYWVWRSVVLTLDQSEAGPSTTTSTESAIFFIWMGQHRFHQVGQLTFSVCIVQIFASQTQSSQFSDNSLDNLNHDRTNLIH